jgi:hypothetical protein
VAGLRPETAKESSGSLKKIQKYFFCKFHITRQVKKEPPYQAAQV